MDASAPLLCEGEVHNGTVRRKTSRLIVACLIMSAILLLFIGCTFVLIDLPISFSKTTWLRSLFSLTDRRCSPSFGKDHTVLLISMDSFRHDYLEIVRKRLGENSLPNFGRFQSSGVRANHSINVFPTVTFPNHHTLVTGLYPESHGVVGNTVWDLAPPGHKFSMGNQDCLNNDPWLVNWPEPIWVTAQRVGRLCGSLLWPLTDGPVSGDLPFQQVSEFTLLDGGTKAYSFAKRVNDLLWWMDNPRYHLDLILAYFSEPDETGHAYGPYSRQVASVVRKLDGHLGALLDGMKRHELLDKVDVILTADHGMFAINHSYLIGLDDYVNSSWYSYTHLSSFGFVYPIDGRFDDVYNALKNAHPHLSVYRRSEVPGYLHFNMSHSRMPPLVLVPHPPWYMVHNATTARTPAGNHGYETNFTDMHPFFIASGPSFLSGQIVPETHAVDVYPLMCALLGIAPQPNNGSLERISKILKPEVARCVLSNTSFYSFWITSDIFSMLLVFFSIGILINYIGFRLMFCRQRSTTVHSCVK